MSVRDVEHRLAQMHPGIDEAHLRPSASTLQNFRKEHLNIEDRVLDDIKQASQLTREAIRHDVVQAEVEKTSAYQTKINSIVDDKLEVQKEFTKICTLMLARIEALYDHVTSHDYIDGKTERLLLGYFEQIQGAYEKVARAQEGGYSNTIDLNVTVDAVASQISVIREAVREILSELDPSLSVTFMQKLHGKLRGLDAPKETDASGFIVEVKNGTE